MTLMPSSLGIIPGTIKYFRVHILPSKLKAVFFDPPGDKMKYGMLVFKRRPSLGIGYLKHYMLGFVLTVVAGMNLQAATHYSIGPNGLESISINDKIIAKGSWTLTDRINWFNAKMSGANLPDPGPGKVENLKDSLGSYSRVTHKQGKIEIITDYRIENEDLKISAFIRNGGQQTIEAPALTGLNLTFSKQPQGQMPDWHFSYLQHQGVNICHPSSFVRIGASYAIDGNIGIAVAPDGASPITSLTHWDPDWGDRNKPVRHLSHIHLTPIAPGAEARFFMSFRAGLSQDWKVLMEPYKSYFRSAYGPRRYNNDHRLFGSDFLNGAPNSQTADNPYGLQSGHRRLDTPTGRQAFIDFWGNALEKSGSQGVMIWGQTGEHPRGAMYRPDFDVIPDPIWKGLEAMAANFKARKLGFGFCTRPGEKVIPIDANTDGTEQLDPNNPAEMEALWARFQKLITLGANSFYLDSFGITPDHVKVMDFLRKKLGPDISTFAEAQSDAMMPYSAVYTEVDWVGPKQRKTDSDTTGMSVLVGMDFIEKVRWLVGDITVVARLHHISPDSGMSAPSDKLLQAAYRSYAYRNKLTPMVDYNLSAEAPVYLEAQKNALDGVLWKGTTIINIPKTPLRKTFKIARPREYLLNGRNFKYPSH